MVIRLPTPLRNGNRAPADSVDRALTELLDRDDRRRAAGHSRSLAYSTVSQLGYISSGLGVYGPFSGRRRALPRRDARVLQGPLSSAKARCIHGRTASRTCRRWAAPPPMPWHQGRCSWARSRSAGRAAALRLLQQGREYLGRVRGPPSASPSSACSATSSRPHARLHRAACSSSPSSARERFDHHHVSHRTSRREHDSSVVVLEILSAVGGALDIPGGAQVVG